MKVLFAVSNEEISESIIKRYQAEYKQIISSKNVYYFNAILKEIQKDKTYDRILISEDLEAFSHTQYDQIDKFIFDKLDSISDEASNVKGKDTPIILISSDRRTKSEQILVKLFGIGVYDALIGPDRSVEEVCKLLNRPRNKKEAKIYYKIDSEEVNYRAENESDVSEIEIQNILTHYKKLGKNEDRYVDSFNNIAAQYNDAQLRIISKFLPLNVRAVLEENSPKYQKIMSFNNSLADSLRKGKKEDESNGPTTKLLKSKVREMPMTSPVIIPSEVNLGSVKKLSKNKKIVNMQAPENQVRQEYQGQGIQNNINKGYNQNQQIEQQPRIRQNEQQNMYQNKPVVKQNEFSNQEYQTEQQVQDTEQKRGRGRPRKAQVVQEQIDNTPKRGRGRPRKASAIQEQNEERITRTGFMDTQTDNYNSNRQYPNNIEEKSSVLPGFEDYDDSDDIENKYNNYNPNTKANSQSSVLPGFEDYDDSDDIENKYNNYNPNTKANSQSSALPGFEEFEDLEEDEAQNNSNENNNNPYNIQTKQSGILPGFEDDDYDNNNYNTSNNYNQNNTNNQYSNNPLEDIYNTRNNEYKAPQNESITNYGVKNIEQTYNKKPEYINTIDISQFLTPDKKIVSFLGTSKNGTSFIINNLAELLSSMGIKTAILDTTTNRNSYYIYTKNEEDLRNIASRTLENLSNGIDQGIQVNKNLAVFTSLPEDNDKINSVDEILETLVKNYSLVLIDTDFNTPVGYFKQSQELYLVQTLDILTIQPLTAFLRELKAKNILEEEKIRIVINKAVKVKGISEKTIIGGMAFYNDPAMSFMTELFDRNMVKYITIPFEDETYVRYLENIINCEISLKGYSKVFMQSLRELGNMVYPIITTGKGEQSGYRPQAGYNTNQGKEGFSPSINSTLNQMKRNY